jgi:hypothetical protein
MMQTIERPGTPSPATAVEGTAAAWDATLERYRRTAAAILNTHVRDAASCAACTHSWPCPSAMTAALALEL